MSASQRVSRGFRRLALLLAAIPLVVGGIATFYIASDAASSAKSLHVKLACAQAKLKLGVPVVLSRTAGTHLIGLPDGSAFEIEGAPDDATALREVQAFSAKEKVDAESNKMNLQNWGC